MGICQVRQICGTELGARLDGERIAAEIITTIKRDATKVAENREALNSPLFQDFIQVREPEIVAETLAAATRVRPLVLENTTATAITNVREIFTGSSEIEQRAARNLFYDTLVEAGTADARENTVRENLLAEKI